MGWVHEPEMRQAIDAIADACAPALVDCAANQRERRATAGTNRHGLVALVLARSAILTALAFRTGWPRRGGMVPGSLRHVRILEGLMDGIDVSEQTNQSAVEEAVPEGAAADVAASTVEVAEESAAAARRERKPRPSQPSSRPMTLSSMPPRSWSSSSTTPATTTRV